MNAKGVREWLQNYMAEVTGNGEISFDDSTMLFEEGIFDSMGFLLLIDSIKEEFNINIKDEELVIENFESINSIINFILKKKQ